MTKIIFEDHADAPLAQIVGMHDGTADDTKGKLGFYVNDGSGEELALTLANDKAAHFGGPLVVWGNDIAGGGTDRDLTIHAEGNIILKCDTDNQEDEIFQFVNGADGVAASITEAGVVTATSFAGALTGNASTATKIESITNSNIVQLTATQTLTNKTLTAPTLTTPALGTPASGVLTNTTGYTGDSSLVTTGTVTSGIWNSTFGATANTLISGSLGSNASLIRSLTAVGISGSFTSVSSSLAARLTEEEAEGFDVSGSWQGYITGSGLVSASAFSSPSQGTVRATINGVTTDVDTGLQVGDSPVFNVISGSDIYGSGLYVSSSASTNVIQVGADGSGGIQKWEWHRDGTRRWLIYNDGRTNQAPIPQDSMVFKHGLVTDGADHINFHMEQDDQTVYFHGDVSASGIVYGSQGYFESDNGTLLTLERNGDQNAAIVFKNSQGYMVAGIDNDAHNDGANVFGIGYVGDIIDSEGQNNATFVVTGSQVVINNATTASNGAALTVGGGITAEGEISSSEAIFAKGTHLDFQVSASTSTLLQVEGNISASGTFSCEKSASIGKITNQKGMFTVNYGTGADITGSLNSAGDGYGDVVSFATTASNIIPGTICYMRNNNATWNRTDADAETTSTPMLGVFLGNSTDVLLRGFVKLAPITGSTTNTIGVPI